MGGERWAGEPGRFAMGYVLWVVGGNAPAGGREPVPCAVAPLAANPPRPMPQMPGWLRFLQGFLPVFLSAGVYFAWARAHPPLWLMGLIFVLLVLGTLLVTRIVWTVYLRTRDL